MSADKLSARELAKRLEDHAATHEIIFGKQDRSEDERQAAAELRRLDASEAALIEALDWCVAEINRDSPACINGRSVLARAKEGRNG